MDNPTPGQHNREPGITDGPGLFGFETRQSDDPVKRDLELIHVECGEHLCDVEPDDTLGILVSLANDHLKERHPDT
jgi:hypothetical protein